MSLDRATVEQWNERLVSGRISLSELEGAFEIVAADWRRQRDLLERAYWLTLPGTAIRDLLDFGFPSSPQAEEEKQ